MLNFLQRTYLSDKEKTRQVKVIIELAWGAMIILTLGTIILGILLPQNFYRWIKIICFVNLLSLSTIYLCKKGLIKTASNMFITILFISTLILTWSTGGIKAPSVQYIPMIVLLTGLLKNWKAGILVGLLGSLSLLGFVIAGNMGFLPQSMVTHSPISLWVISAICISLLILLQYLSISGLNKALFEANKELSQREIIEEELRRSETYRLRIFEGSKIPIVVMDAETYEYIDCNEAAIKIYGFSSKAETLGQTPAFVSAPIQYDGTLSLEKAKHYIEKAKAEGNVVFEWKHQRQNGECWDSEVHLMSFQAEKKELLQFTIIDITERKKVEKELKESETKLRVMFENSRDAISVSKNGIRCYANPAFIKMYGYDSDTQIEGKSILESIAPSHHDQIIRNVEKRYSGQSAPSFYETKGRKQDGTEFDMEISISSYKLNGEMYSVAMIRDISKRKQSQEAVKLNELRLESLLRISQYKSVNIQAFLDYALNEAIQLTNSKLGYIYFYDELKKEFTLNTWSKEVMKECTVQDANNVYQLEKTGIWGDVVRNGEAIMVNDFHMPNPQKKGYPEGHVALHKFLSIPVYDDNKIVAVVGVANKETNYDNSDIRQLMLMMDSVWKYVKRLESEEKLVKALAKSEENDKLKTAFLQNMSHEIRTPLNGIIRFSSLIGSEDISREEIIEFSGIIKNCGDKLIEIVNNVLDLSKIETGQIKVQNKAFSVNSILSDLSSFFLPPANSKNLKLNYYIDLENEKSIIHSDDSKLFQILNNLINNAIKFTDSGKIDFGYEIKGSEIEFYVKDTGIGIPDDMQYRIFERFAQVDTSISRSYEGAGLGLSICRGLVELLGGRIWFESEINKGTEFFFTIPLVYAEKIIEAIPIENINANSRKIMKVLVAEDDRTSFEFLKRVLSGGEFEILHAENGLEALEFVKNTRDIDIVLMDIRMPYLDGMNATKEIKKIRPELPIIAQTAYAFSNEKEDIIANGCNDYISKPILKGDLMKLIDKYRA